MKKLPLFIGVLAAALSFTSCKDHCTQVVQRMKDVPVYKTLDEVRAPISTEAARTLQNPGKIYLYSNYILINEIDEGVHVIDNSDATNPQNIAFIKIPGNVDIAMKGSVLYADNYIDLLAIDLTNPTDAQLLKRVENVFPTHGTNPDNADELLVKYTQEIVEEEVKCDELNNGWGGGVMFEDAVTTTTAGGAGGGAGRMSTGMGGSMSRFAITGDYLYAISSQDLHVISILTLDDPTHVNSVMITNGAETIFPDGASLFIGGNTGMDIYDCSSPTNPTYLSRFEHAFACDPVFVDGNTAYITLRTASPCRQSWENRLDIVDVSSLTNPQLLASHWMENPHGLSVRDEMLYLCEGEFGLKGYNVQNPLNIDIRFEYNQNHAYDVIAIPHTDRLLMVGEDGFYQYDVVNSSSLLLLSKIEVPK